MTCKDSLKAILDYAKDDTLLSVSGFRLSLEKILDIVDREDFQKWDLYFSKALLEFQNNILKEMNIFDFLDDYKTWVWKIFSQYVWVVNEIYHNKCNRYQILNNDLYDLEKQMQEMLLEVLPDVEMYGIDLQKDVISISSHDRFQWQKHHFLNYAKTQLKNFFDISKDKEDRLNLLWLRNEISGEFNPTQLYKVFMSYIDMPERVVNEVRQNVTIGSASFTLSIKDNNTLEEFAKMIDKFIYVSSVATEVKWFARWVDLKYLRRMEKIIVNWHSFKLSDDWIITVNEMDKGVFEKIKNYLLES